MVSTKPIQDRIYRSRLTITYRTNVDGVLVPKKLPFRVLCLGNFTGPKPVDATGASLPALTDQSVVTLRKGANLDDVMRAMSVTLEVPAEKVGPRAALQRGTALSCIVTGGPLVGDVGAVNDKGQCPVSGAVEVVSMVHDNGDHELRGMLDASGTATLVAGLDDPGQTLALEGLCPSRVTGSADAATANVSDAATKTFTVDVAGDLPVQNSLSSSAPWKTFKFTGKLEGEVLPSATAGEGMARVTGLLDLEDAQSDTTKQIAKDDLPHFAGTAQVTVASTGNGTWKVKDGTKVTVAVDEDMDIQVSLEAKAGDLLQVPDTVGKRGDIAFGVKAGTAAPHGAPSMELTLAGALTVNPVNMKATGDPDSPATLHFGFTPTAAGAAKGELLAHGVRITTRAKTVDFHAAGKFAEQAKDGIAPETPIVGSASGKQTLQDQPITVAADGSIGVRVAGGTVQGERLMAFTSLESFYPDSVAASIPEVRRLEVIKDLLVELRGDLNLSARARQYLAKGLLTFCDPDYEDSGRLPVLYAMLRSNYATLVVDPDAPVPEHVPPMEKLSKHVHDRQLDWYNQESKGFSEGLFAALELRPPSSDDWWTKNQVVEESQGDVLMFHDRDADVSDDATRLQNALIALILNGADLDTVAPNTIADRIDAIVATIDATVQDHLRYVLHSPAFRDLERSWISASELFDDVEDDQVLIDLFDASKEDLAEDLKDHKNDIFTSALFKKVYVDEYDRFGGQPFGVMIGLYWFDCSDADVEDWLTPMSQIANAAHCPFVASVESQFFGAEYTRWDDLETIGDIEAHLSLPRFGKWNVLRDGLEAPYLGLTLPGYLLRKPWKAPGQNQTGDLGNRTVKLDEIDEKDQEDNDQYLWGSTAVLMGRNMIRSFEQSGWCQYIRGVKGGGLVQGMTVNTITRHGQEEAQSPVWYDIPDYREYQFAKSGLIPLVHNKGTADAAFFSVQSLKKPYDYMSEIDTQNSYLVTNLAYTLSITRIAHYVKAMMRDYIGSSLDAAYIQKTLELWLSDYVTTAVNPDDLTLRFYPFKAVSVVVEPKPGPLGWFKATVSVLPHVQFEGMDVELRLEAALGGSK